VLAAFVDRQLDETSRRRVVNHVARCLDCYEVVADSLHFVGLGGAAGRRTLEVEEDEDDALAGGEPGGEPAPPSERGDIAAARPQPRAPRRSWAVVALALAALLALAAGLWWRARAPLGQAPQVAVASPLPSPRTSPVPTSPSPVLRISPDPSRSGNGYPATLEPALEARLEGWQVRGRVAFGTSGFSRPCALAAGALAALADETRKRGASAQLAALAAWPAWGLRGCDDAERALAVAQVRAPDRERVVDPRRAERAAWLRLGYELETWSAWSERCVGAPPSRAGLSAAQELLADHPVRATLDDVVTLAEEAPPWSTERCARLGTSVSGLRAILLY
jgi:hypothetical protein